MKNNFYLLFLWKKINRWQNANNNFSAVIPYDLEQQRIESKEFLDDLTTRNQRMFLVVLTILQTADSLEKLNIY